LTETEDQTKSNQDRIEKD